MGNRRDVLAEGETYHIYNRGAHKGELFKTPEDYRRFALLMYLANSDQHFVMRDLFAKYYGQPMEAVFDEPVEQNLVDVLAYTLMPNHVHLVLRQKSGDGITKYLKKLFVAYSMYFNLKHEHSGTLLQGRFKSKHIDTEEYFRYIFAYVHLNPLDVAQPGWKEAGVKSPKALRKFMDSYPYSSYFDYWVGSRPDRKILTTELPDFLKTQNDFEDLLCWSRDLDPAA